METPNNAKELREQLTEHFASLGSDDLSVKAATELSNMAGKIIASIKMQLEYAKLKKEKPSIQVPGLRVELYEPYRGHIAGRA